MSKLFFMSPEQHLLGMFSRNNSEKFLCHFALDPQVFGKNCHNDYFYIHRNVLGDESFLLKKKLIFVSNYREKWHLFWKAVPACAQEVFIISFRGIPTIVGFFRLWAKLFRLLLSDLISTCTCPKEFWRWLLFLWKYKSSIFSRIFNSSTSYESSS